MNRVQTIVAVVVGTLVVSMAGSMYWLSKSLQEARDDLSHTKAQVTALSASVEALEGRLGRVTAGIRQLEQRRGVNDAVISEALRENRDWAAAPTPPDVVDGLCTFLDCVPGDSAGEVPTP